MSEKMLSQEFSVPANGVELEDSPFIPNAIERGLHTAVQRLAAASLALPEVARMAMIEDAYGTIADKEAQVEFLQPQEPMGWMGQKISTVAEVSASYTPEIATMTAGAVTLGPWGAAGGGAVMGGIQSFGESVLQSLRGRGVELTDEDAVRAVVNDAQEWDNITQSAIKDAGMGAALWGTFGYAGSMASAAISAGHYATASGIFAGTQVATNAAAQAYADPNHCVDLERSFQAGVMAAVTPVNLPIRGYAFMGAPAISGRMAGSEKLIDDGGMATYCFDEGYNGEGLTPEYNERSAGAVSPEPTQGAGLGHFMREMEDGISKAFRIPGF